MTLMPEIAPGARPSQLTMSPKGSFARMPSTYTASPSDAPSSGDPPKPRNRTSGWKVPPWTSLASRGAVPPVRSAPRSVTPLAPSGPAMTWTLAGMCRRGSPDPCSGVTATTSTVSATVTVGGGSGGRDSGVEGACASAATGHTSHATIIQRNTSTILAIHVGPLGAAGQGAPRAREQSMSRAGVGRTAYTPTRPACHEPERRRADRPLRNRRQTRRWWHGRGLSRA